MLQGCGTAASVIDGSSVEAHMNIMKRRAQTLLTLALSCLAHVSISLSLSLSLDSGRDDGQKACCSDHTEEQGRVKSRLNPMF